MFQAMESCPRKEVENFKEKLVEENFYVISEVRSCIHPTAFYLVDLCPLLLLWPFIFTCYY
jgi:hypothetical protein